jgi:hypothetical protein
MARAKRTPASSSSWSSFFQELIVSERAVLSLRISLVSSGVSQKLFLDMIISISSSRFFFSSKSKITPELF